MRKLMVFGISVIMLLLISCVSAQDINFDYPAEVNYGEEFQVTLELVDFQEDTYDIKIDITDNGGSRISQILNNGEWKSTYNYVRDAIDTSSDDEVSFSLNITEEYVGTATIEVKTRDSSSQIESFPDYEIEVLDGGEEEEEQQEEEQEQQESEGTDIYLDMDWEEEDIVNGEEFEIKIEAFDLEDKVYDLKVYILDEDEELISEIFNEEDDEWKSGNYYLREVLQGQGDDSKKVTVRIDEEFRDFKGDATIKARIRETGTTPIISEEQYEIEVLEAEDREEAEEDIEIEEVEEEQQEEEPEEKSKSTIRLNGKATGRTVEEKEETEEKVEKEEVKILYESASEKMKKYAIYGLNVVLIGIIIFLLISFKNKRN